MSDLVKTLATVLTPPDLSFFEYGSRQVRTAVIDGEIYFGLADVLKAMKSTTTTSQAQESIFDGLGKGHVIVSTLSTLGGEQNLLFVDEAALTFLLSRSRTEAGKGLNRLIHTQILPSIRATGRYEVVKPAAIAPAAIAPAPTSSQLSRLDILQMAMAAEHELQEAVDKNLLLEAQIELDAALVVFANAVQSVDENILVGTLAKSLGIGPNNLMGLLRCNRILMTSTNPAHHNIPFQLYINRGYFVVDEGTIEANGKTRLTFTTKVTPKGQIWLTNKYYQWQNVAA